MPIKLQPFTDEIISEIVANKSPDIQEGVRRKLQSYNFHLAEYEQSSDPERKKELFEYLTLIHQAHIETKRFTTQQRQRYQFLFNQFENPNPDFRGDKSQPVDAVVN